jgi:hyperosmotically inducible protein
MTKHTILAGLSGLALVLGAVGCNSPVETTNTNTTRNSNTAIVVNDNANRVAVTDNRNHAITREEYEKDKDKYSREAKEGGSKIGQGADDLWLWTKTRAALLGEDNLRDSTINVDVDNNIVTLKGTVASADQKARAEAVAKGIEGVKSVKNTLVVSASGATTPNSNTKATNAKKS